MKDEVKEIIESVKKGDDETAEKLIKKLVFDCELELLNDLLSQMGTTHHEFHESVVENEIHERAYKRK